MGENLSGGTGAAAHRIRFITVTGGFLDGLGIEFTERLNCIIGGRGTGKTTIVELLRYAFDVFPEDPTARQRIKALIEKNLDFGRVDVGIQTKEKLSYIVSRSAGEEPVVLAEERKPTEIQLTTGDLFVADVFSQNEVESIADQPLSQLQLIDNFEAQRIAEFTHRLRKLKIDLSANANATEPLLEKAASLREELKELPAIEERLKGFASASGANSDVINDAHAKKVSRAKLWSYFLSRFQGSSRTPGGADSQAAITSAGVR